MSEIRARFRLRRETFALDVDLTIPGRGVTALYGASGSGKTTVLRLLAGLERTSDGFLSVGDAVWQDGALFVPTHRRPLGYVFQDANLFPHLSVRANLDYGWRSVPEADRKVSLDHVIDLLGIRSLLARKPASLSGGEKQRVGMARALATSPRLLLMDEPLASLDSARKQEILPYLETLHDELEIPVVYVSHATNEVARLADHLVVLDNGKAVAQGALADVLARLDLPIPLGEEAGVVIEAKVAERDERWALARFEFSGGSLWARDQGAPAGKLVRVRVLARDVSVSLGEMADSSILNRLPGTVDAIGPGEHAAQALLRVRLENGTPLLARLTRRSVEQLQLCPGKPIWSHIKSVALMNE
jgi:molybdate transport system ATP-binding protein